MAQKRNYSVAIAGATGAVGSEMIKILQERAFPVDSIRMLASKRSVGKRLSFQGEDVAVEELTKDSFTGVDIALFSAGGGRSLEFAPAAAKAGAVVIDNSSAFRMEDDIPLVVPEVNPHAVADYTNRGIIANPNCSTIQMVVALKPLYDEVKIRRIVVSTYQAVSGTGAQAVTELEEQTRALIEGKPAVSDVYPHQIAFNCLPHIDVFTDDGYSKEELKMVNETRKILEDPDISVTATTVRVPVYYGHSESVNVEFYGEFSPDRARKILSQAPGVVVIDDPAKNLYPLAIDAAGKDDNVGRIRKDFSIENGLNLWIVSDNLRKGAALNAVQIAELLVDKYL